MTSDDDSGNVGLARKATWFMTNDEYIAEAVDRRCFGGHEHMQLLNVNDIEWTKQGTTDVSSHNAKEVAAVAATTEARTLVLPFSASEKTWWHGNPNKLQGQWGCRITNG